MLTIAWIRKELLWLQALGVLVMCSIVIPFDLFPTKCNITQFIYFWKTALHVSGGISTHHQAHTQLYLQYLVLVKPLVLPVAIVEEL